MFYTSSYVQYNNYQNHAVNIMLMPRKFIKSYQVLLSLIRLLLVHSR